MDRPAQDRSVFSFRPRLFECLRDYSWPKFVADVLAGLTVGVVALPLAIGLGVASGVTPGAGIYTAIIGGFLVSALGGSRVQIGGAPGGVFWLGFPIVVAVWVAPPLLFPALARAGPFFFRGLRRRAPVSKN